MNPLWYFLIAIGTDVGLFAGVVLWMGRGQTHEPHICPLCYPDRQRSALAERQGRRAVHTTSKDES